MTECSCNIDMTNVFENEYLRICNTVLNTGTLKLNERTGINCLFYHGDMMKFDLSTGKFPLLTTRKMYTKQMVAELLGFIRGYDNAKQFRDLGCNFWNENANTSKHWVENPNRKGEDDLGRIYGVQARNWQSYVYKEDQTKYGDCLSYIPNRNSGRLEFNYVDQLKNVVDKLSKGIDDRRLIVSHWNPGELNLMSLPPCHLLYQFGIRDEYLDLSLYQRSCDVPLGISANIPSYALLIALIAQITGLKPGIFTHFMHNIHFYENQIDGIKEQILRQPLEAPTVWINPKIKSLEDLETWVTTDDIKFENYNHHPAIVFPFAA